MHKYSLNPTSKLHPPTYYFLNTISFSPLVLLLNCDNCISHLCFCQVNMNRPGDWNCRSCQHLNFQRRDMCQRCGEPKPGERGGDYGGSFGGRGGGGGSGGSPFGFSTGPDVRPGDWYCTIGNCGAHNFASRSSCFKCGSFKEDSSSGSFDSDMSRSRGFGFGGGGGGASGSSRSGWKSGDWICTRPGCNEHNFASRTECFKCNAPRDSASKSSF